jgi:ParB-like chromosome segregation protein Spo0J
MAEQTIIWDVFDYIFEADRRRMGRIKPLRTYRNPVFLAREWEKMLCSGEYASQSALAQKLGVSRVRVTQVLRLLKLPPEVLEKIAGLGDHLTSRTVTERKLRPLVNPPKGKRRIRIRRLLQKYAHLY